MKLLNKNYSFVLLFFILILLINPLLNAKSLYASYSISVPYMNVISGIKLIIYIKFFLTIFIAIYGLYIGLSLLLHKKGAIKKTKIFLNIFVFCTIIGHLILFIPDWPATTYKLLISFSLENIARNILFAGFFYIYFSFSKKIKEIFPES